MKVSFIQLSWWLRQSLPTSFHESQYAGWSSRMSTIGSILYSKHAGCVLRLLNRIDCYVWLYQKNLWLFMFEMHLISGITDGWQECEPPPAAKLNVKTPPLPSLYFGIYYSFDFSRLLFFCVFRSVFRWLRFFCTGIQYRICYCSSTIFWVLASALPSAKLPHGSNLLLRHCTWSKQDCTADKSYVQG